MKNINFFIFLISYDENESKLIIYFKYQTDWEKNCDSFNLQGKSIPGTFINASLNTSGQAVKHAQRSKAFPQKLNKTVKFTHFLIYSSHIH